MKCEPVVVRTLDLAGGTLTPFASVPGERVRVLRGSVWLTEEGSPNDSVLGRGEELVLATRGLAVIEALVPSRIQLMESAWMSNFVVIAAQRMVRQMMLWWVRQFRQPTAVNAVEF